MLSFEPSANAIYAELGALHASSFGWALLCAGRNNEDARDILQQAYVKVYAGKATFEGRSSLRTWFFGIIRLTALEHRRFRLLRFRKAPLLTQDEADEAPSPSESVADRQMARAVAEVLLSLPERQRQVLHLVFYEGLSLREAAGVMDVALGSASQHYERAKLRMKQLLTEKGMA
jgi:RNA polymerase sigma factor (sigma-70 family)